MAHKAVFGEQLTNANVSESASTFLTEKIGNFSYRGLEQNLQQLQLPESLAFNALESRVLKATQISNETGVRGAGPNHLISLFP